MGNGLFGRNCVFSLEEDPYYMVMSPNAFVINKHHMLEIALLEECVFSSEEDLYYGDKMLSARGKSMLIYCSV